MKIKLFTLAIAALAICLLGSCKKEDPKVSVTGISLDKTELTIRVGGQPVQLTATVAPENATEKSVNWSSSAESVATVDASGKVTAVVPGDATIAVATVDGGMIATCAVKVKAALPANALPGEFSVSTTEKVLFSKGNLVATIDATGTPTAWKFAAHQYDYLGEGGANKTIGTAAGDVDLFCWSTASTTYGISTSTEEVHYYGNFVDWGKAYCEKNNITPDNAWSWRTLSKDEWVYLFETRTNASSLYKYGVTVCGKDNCLIIAPDNWDTSANPLQTSYDATAWATAEAAGLVCLPAAGRRYGSSVSSVGVRGYYWSSTISNIQFVYGVCFDSRDVTPYYGLLRYYGDSVRLITESK